MRSVNNDTYYDDVIFYRTITASLQRLFICPVDKPYKITSDCAARADVKNKNGNLVVAGSYHQALDISKPGNVPVKAVADGEIVECYIAPDGKKYSGHPVYGGYYIIRHEQGIHTVYAHLKTTEIKIIGVKVKQGDILGYMGATGKATGQHLHFEIFIDPKFLFEE